MPFAIPQIGWKIFRGTGDQRGSLTNIKDQLTRPINRDGSTAAEEEVQRIATIILTGIRTYCAGRGCIVWGQARGSKREVNLGLSCLFLIVPQSLKHVRQRTIQIRSHNNSLIYNAGIGGNVDRIETRARKPCACIYRVAELQLCLRYICNDRRLAAVETNKCVGIKIIVCEKFVHPLNLQPTQQIGNRK